MKKKFLIGMLMLTLCIINPYKVEARITDCVYQIDYCITGTVGGSSVASGATTKHQSTYTLTVHDNYGFPKVSIACKSGSCKRGTSIGVSSVFSIANVNDFKDSKGNFKCPTLYKCSKCPSQGSNQGKYYSNQTSALNTTSNHQCMHMTRVKVTETKTTASGSAVDDGIPPKGSGGGVQRY